MKAQALLSLALVSALTAWLVWQRRRSPLAVQQALFLLLWNPLLLFDIAGKRTTICGWCWACCWPSLWPNAAASTWP
ncbi:hypothetical protein [Candidatus Amarolinea dominans]|uniref:hypothetical protein n=1 Tax=Candidatus Amarolinea dominans TaxID=3140696 RepID=UPI0031355C21|nr:hypothetical protein [Anaerolineae bacterium]